MTKIANGLGRGTILAALATLLVLAVIAASAAPGEAKKKKPVNADTLDGKDSTEFLGKSEKTADSDKLDGKDSTGFLSSSVYTKSQNVAGTANGLKQATISCDTGDVILNGGYFFAPDATGYQVTTDAISHANDNDNDIRYFLFWKSDATPDAAIMYATCADQNGDRSG